MKVAIAGYGLEGQSSYRYYHQKGEEVTIVTDKVSPDFAVPEGAKSIIKHNVFDDILDFDLVLRSPPLQPSHIKTTGKIWSATNEFFAHCPAPIIGVTGTKGKGTTSSFVASILRAAGMTVHLVGNIGTPALDVLPSIRSDDVVVFELSSFQLWDLEKSPHIAIVLPIEADHLDIHASFDEYVQAKAQIVCYQMPEDVVVYHEDNQFSRSIGEQSPAGKKVTYPIPIPKAYKEAVRLPGAHNVENATAAIVAASFLTNLSSDVIIKGLGAFTGLPHRLKFVADKNGVKYYDDSIATTPGSAIAAINSFSEPKILILGGHEKGGDYTELLNDCSRLNVRVIAYGANRDALKELCDHHGVSCDTVDGFMEAVVSHAAKSASPGDVVILSPAAASFDMFKNYIERGEKFIHAVKELS